jgi:hypothetical protein
MRQDAQRKHVVAGERQVAQGSGQQRTDQLPGAEARERGADVRHVQACQLVVQNPERHSKQQQTPASSQRTLVTRQALPHRGPGRRVGFDLRGGHAAHASGVPVSVVPRLSSVRALRASAK